MSYAEWVNDPYDCSVRSEELEKLPIVIDDILPTNQVYNDIIKSFRKFPELQADMIQEKKKMVNFQKNEKKQIEIECEKVFDSLKTTKIACFSTKKDSILMWSHYADYHKGFCIEYKNSENSDFFKRIMPVIYSHTFYCWKDYKYFLITKYKDWSCENEWRYWEMEQDTEYVNSPTPTAVYCGAKMSEYNIKQIVKIAKKNSFDVYQIYPAKDRYELDFKEIYKI